MRICAPTFSLLLFLGAGVFATVPTGHDNRPQAQAFFYGAPGVVTSDVGSSAVVQFGAGAEGFVSPRVGVSVDLGWLSDFDAGGGVVLSPSVSFRFGTAPSTIPFLNGGFSLFFVPPWLASRFHFGGGVDRWLKDRLGIRFEARHHVAFSGSTRNNLLQGRVALLIR